MEFWWCHTNPKVLHHDRRKNKTVDRFRVRANILVRRYQCSPEERAALLKVAKPDLIHAVRNCITIIVHDKIPIMRQQKGILGKKKIILRELSSK